MVRRKNRMRDVSLEEMDNWAASVQTFKECSEAADEEGGPRLSFVPPPKLLNVEILPDEVDASPKLLDAELTSLATLHAVPFAPELSRVTPLQKSAHAAIIVRRLSSIDPR